MRRLQDRPARVVVAMSGGVDSSTVAALLVEQGHEVIGVTMKLYDHTDDPDSDGTCCSLDDVADARRVAEHLGIPFYVGNYEKVFKQAVIDDFVAAYAAGRTPNPCVKCNDVVKFRSLLSRTRGLGADFLATGHYARTQFGPDGAIELHEGVDISKDQTYFLAGIGDKALQRVVFPLGEMTKAEVREAAERFELPVAHKAESQEICFIPDGDYARFVEEQLSAKASGGATVPGPGRFVSMDGLTMGRHRGIHHYTVGQRRGLALPGPERTYVVDVRPEENAVVVGDARAVLAGGLWASKPTWLGQPPARGAQVRVRIRHRHRGVAARLTEREPDRLEVCFDEPVSAVAVGQQVALYAGTRVLGSATIEGRLPHE